MPDTLRVACVQTSATPDTATNLQSAELLVRAAAADGAAFIALPEAFDHLVPTAPEMHAYAAPEEAHRAAGMVRRLSDELNIWILAGSVSARARDGAVVNRSLLAAPGAGIAARYDKIHLFDVDLPDGGSVRESDFYRPGANAVVADTPWGGIGLSICYDVRFPLLHRALAAHGARMLAVPAAFSSVTGPLHWEPLLRTRAIETGCFVIAPAQCGHHYGERRSHGHSLIIDPWGRVLADGGTEPGYIVADLDLTEVERFRGAIPSLANARVFEMGEGAV